MYKKRSWFWSCHQVPISVIRSLPVTKKKSAKCVAGNKIYDLFQRHICYEIDFFFVAAMKFVAGIQFCRSATTFGSDKSFMKRPPGLPPLLFVNNGKFNILLLKFLLHSRIWQPLATTFLVCCKNERLSSFVNVMNMSNEPSAYPRPHFASNSWARRVAWGTGVNLGG